MNVQAAGTEQKLPAGSSRRIQIILKHAEPVAKRPDSLPLSPHAESPLHKDFSRVFEELEQMIGLDRVKKLVYEVYALLEINRYRTEAGLSSRSNVYHMVFKGNPGTGKTTVARIVAKLFHSMGVLDKGHLIEAERADLVGEYIGHTAIKTRELVKRAMGGILFIDEAYSLARGGDKDFGKEAMDALVKAMEDNKNGFILILAGYSDEMDRFMKINPGMTSRFPIQLEFPDYSVDELMRIAGLMAAERDYRLIPETVLKLRNHLSQEKARMTKCFSNARYVRNIIEKSVRRQAVRLLSRHTSCPSKEELMAIRPEDLKFDPADG